MSQLRTASCDPVSRRNAEKAGFVTSSINKFIPIGKGLNVAAVDIKGYNEEVSMDSGNGAIFIAENVRAAYLVYTDGTFDSCHAFSTTYLAEGRWAVINAALHKAMLRLTEAYESKGYGNFSYEMKFISYPEGAFTPNSARHMEEEAECRRANKEYYDPVKLALATGLFQYFTPSERLQRLWEPQKLIPILFHNVYGGWFELEGVIFIKALEAIKRWPFIPYWDAYRPVPQVIRDSLILSRTINNGSNDLWRDYPKSTAQYYRYDLRTYTKLKAGISYEEWDHPFVRAIKIVKAFKNHVSRADTDIKRHTRNFMTPYSSIRNRPIVRDAARSASAEREALPKPLYCDTNQSAGSAEPPVAPPRFRELKPKQQKSHSPTAGATDEVDASPEGMLSPADASLSSKKLTTIRDEEEIPDGDLDEVTENPDCTTRSTAQ
ncbi:methylmalonic aciduria and homocystinuria type C protein homolog [Babesia caballi]|uniref:Methylmalonic aciduria and homocystinuria type C protein homolog n=1 Tax=Babesia caballi TaxID=5871 RepID=A0AAV4LS29_BABCB|nr:methylmalonic aciduria and homocystinuria type C protein homolog [Babesia caballi]